MGRTKRNLNTKAMTTLDMAVKIEVESDNDADSDYKVDGMGQEDDDEHSGEEEGKSAEERRRERRRLYDKKRRESLTPEQRAKILERKREWRKNATPEQRAKEVERSRMRRKNLTPEQRAKERERKRRREQCFIKDEEPSSLQPRNPLSDESLEKQKERHRQYIIQETPEQRQERAEKKKQARKRYLERMTEEQRKEYRLRRYFQRKAREANMSKEEREESLRKMAAHVKNYIKNLPPDKKEIFRKKQIERSKEQMKKRYNNQPEKVLEHFRKKTATETPERRQARLHRYKINAAKKKLKKQLEEEGLPIEDIEKRCEELAVKMRSEPLPPLTSQYKPRPSGRKPKKMSVKPPGRRPYSIKNVFSGTSECSNNEKSAYKYTPMPSMRKPKSWGILYEIEMKGKASLLNLQQPNTTVTSSEKELQFSSSQHKNYISSSTSTKNAKLDSVSETFHDDPSSPGGGGGDDDDHCSPDVECYGDDDDDSNYTSQQQLDNLPPPSPANSCPHCNLSFETESELSSHITIDHPFKCPICSDHVSNSTKLVSHFNTQHSKDQFSFVCMRCPWNVENLSKNSCFRTHKSLLHHVQRCHSSNYWPCPTCNLLLYSESRFKSHFEVCTTALEFKQVEKDPFLCGYCGKEFSTRGLYHKHINHFHHPDREKFVCPCCKRSCSYTRSFWNHFVKCANLIPGIDKVEKLTNKNNPPNLSPQSLEERKKWYRKRSGPIPCDQCGKTFAQKCTLNDHIRRYHGEGESFVCPQCGISSFQSAGKLWRHQSEVHGLSDLPPPPGVEVMRCLYCQDLVMRGYELHVKKKHPEHLKEFQTNELPQIKEKLKEVKKSNPKRKHTKLSTLINSSKVTCPICSVTITQGCLSRHMKRRHSSVLTPDEVDGRYGPPVACTVCDKTLVNNEQFQYHYAERHAFHGIEDNLLSKNLISTRLYTEENFVRKEATCLICNVLLPMDRFSVRVHFVTAHYSQLMEVVEEGAGDVDTSAL